MIWMYFFIVFGLMAYLASALNSLTNKIFFGWIAWTSGLSAFITLTIFELVRANDINNGFLMLVSMLNQMALGK